MIELPTGNVSNRFPIHNHCDTLNKPKNILIMKHSLLLSALATVLLLGGCTKSEDSAQTLSVDPLSLTFEATGNTAQTITINGNVQWQHTMSETAASWITAERIDDATLSISVADNSTYNVRNGLVTIEPVNATDPTLKSSQIQIVQKGLDTPEYEITVIPSALNFASTDAEPQTFNVTTNNDALQWNAAPEEEIVDWVSLAIDGGQITVSVENNTDTLARSGNIIITPDSEFASAKAVKITQDGVILSPSLSTDITKLSFEYNNTMPRSVVVTAYKVTWTVEIECDDPSDPWINATPVGSVIQISVDPNPTTVAREGYVVVKSSDPEVEDVRIHVMQSEGRLFMSTLEDHLAIADLSPASGMTYTIYPSQVWDTDKPGTMWNIELLGSGVTRSRAWNGSIEYSGNGTRLVLSIYTTNIVYNDERNFTIPDGTYNIMTYATVVNRDDIVPNTIEAGKETYSFDYPAGSWYVEVVNGAFTGKVAPLYEGTIDITYNGNDSYTFEINAKDDAGYNITAQCSATITETSVQYFEENPPTDEPDTEEPIDPMPEL